jgi:hypothetical protein
VVTGSFTDAAGNAAAQITAPRLLNIANAPEPLVLSGYLSDGDVIFDWNTSEDPDFASYRLYEDDNATVNPSGSTLIHFASSRATTSFTYDPSTSGTRYFRLYVYDAQGLYSASNTVPLTIP